MFYVDASKHRYGRMVMCHLVADTVAELHSVAKLLGLDRRWFQDDGLPHYDICKDKRARALALGALQVSTRDIVRVSQALRIELDRERMVGHNED